MPKKTTKPHVYKVGQPAEFQLTLAGKVQSIAPKGKFLVVTKVFPIKVKKPSTKMVAGRRGGGLTPITGPVRPDACGGHCSDTIQWSGNQYAFDHCETSGSPAAFSIACFYRRL
jgi:hypothetical protein